MRVAKAVVLATVGSASLAAVAFAVPSADASTPFVSGTATGVAQAMQIAPRTGGFAYTMTIGNSIADYRGTLAQAESQTFDPGLIGTSLTSEQCDGSKPTLQRSQLPQPLIAESDHGNQSKSADTAGNTQSGLLAASGHETVAVTTVPTSSATFDGGTVGIKGLVEASGMSSAATARLIPGKSRIATAESTVGRLSLLGGAVVFDNLHWTATQRTGAGAAAKGTFTVGDVLVAGHAVPASAAALASAFDAVNTALGKSGLHISLPTPQKTSGGGLEVPPMSIGVDNSALGAAVVNPLLTAAQPVTQQIEQALLGISCKFGSAFTVEDIFLSAVDGTGGLDLRFGGVSAGSDGQAYANPFGNVSLGMSSALTGGTAAIPGTPGTTTTGVGGVTPPGGATVGAPAGSAPQLAPQAQVSKSCSTTSSAHWPSCSNGAALVAGLLGLAAVGGVGGADWLATRRRRRLPQLDL